MFVSEFSESGGQRGQDRDKRVKREGDGSCGVGDGTRRSSLPESRGGRTGSRLSFKDILPMGDEEEDLVFLCVRAEMETEPGSRVVCGGSAIC